MAYDEELDRRIKKIVSRWKGTADKKIKISSRLLSACPAVFSFRSEIIFSFHFGNTTF
jgi:hypothetical protein